MALTQFATTMQNIESISIRAIFGACLLMAIFLIVANLFSSNTRIKYYAFLCIVGVISITTGVLLATALYVTANPTPVFDWSVVL
jgi:hypothetical protein